VATRVFSDEDLERLRSFPEITREELIRFFTMTPADVEFIDPGRGRGRSDRLGLAVQLCTLPWLGFVPDDVASAPAAAVARVSERLQIPMDELRLYGEREQTRTDHLRAVARYLGWHQAGALEFQELDEFLLARAMEHDSPTLLFRLACEHLISARVIRPGVVRVIERVATAREAASRETFDRVAHLLTARRQLETRRIWTGMKSPAYTGGDPPKDAPPAMVEGQDARGGRHRPSPCVLRLTPRWLDSPAR
jgi:uncharacterized protein DUF4158